MKKIFILALLLCGVIFSQADYPGQSPTVASPTLNNSTFGTSYRETNGITVSNNISVNTNYSWVVITATSNTIITLPTTTNALYKTIWFFNASTNTVTLTNSGVDLFFGTNETKTLTLQGDSAGVFFGDNSILWVK
jgi:hypothetical protein